MYPDLVRERAVTPLALSEVGSNPITHTDMKMFDEVIPFQFDIHKDGRGMYAVYYCKPFTTLDIPAEFREDAFSLSNKGVIRGFHQERGGWARGRIVCCIQGSVQDAVLRLSDNQVRTTVLTPGMGLFIPKEFAHAFLALEDNTILMYKFEKQYMDGMSISPFEFDIDWMLDKHDIISITKKDLFGDNN